jgi:hypothetical protein
MLIIDPKAFAHSLISSEQQGMMASWNAQGTKIGYKLLRQ